MGGIRRGILVPKAYEAGNPFSDISIIEAFTLEKPLVRIFSMENSSEHNHSF